MTETNAATEIAFDAFIDSYALREEKDADCLAKDHDALLAYYDFPGCEFLRRPGLVPIKVANQPEPAAA